MEQRTTIRGNAASDPEHVVSKDGNTTFCTFRLAANVANRDRSSGEWKVDATNWYTVKAFGRHGLNVLASVRKGDPVIVEGRLRVTEWQREDGKRNYGIDVLADAVGFNMAYGTSTMANRRGNRPVDGPPRPEQLGPDGAPAIESGLDGDDGADAYDPETGELLDQGPSADASSDVDAADHQAA
ncbi:single-stranded DNA-binding protein [Zafaria sp. Z1313]|uniref:single-stranded DNA-binding protein n=1 Tax=unclassified Zafaria TaxID=2828765 RepID=UPI002E76067F|nr:single-stranded DNA-binding protein [Zafaria sp. J156]MEE1620649.1 single-stranded DNA-binding protein [Zafaria sp. J156]